MSIYIYISLSLSIYIYIYSRAAPREQPRLTPEPSRSGAAAQRTLSRCPVENPRGNYPQGLLGAPYLRAPSL